MVHYCELMKDALRHPGNPFRLFTGCFKYDPESPVHQKVGQCMAWMMISGRKLTEGEIFHNGFQYIDVTGDFWTSADERESREGALVCQSRGTKQNRS